MPALLLCLDPCLGKCLSREVAAVLALLVEDEKSFVAGDDAIGGMSAARRIFLHRTSKVIGWVEWDQTVSCSSTADQPLSIGGCIRFR